MIKKEPSSVVKKTAVKKIEKVPKSPALKFFEGVGRRKTAVARVRIQNGQGKSQINGKDSISYFGLVELKEIAMAPISELKIPEKFDVSIKVMGGGVRAQAEAIRHGLSRALVDFNEDFKKRLRGLGFLTRDSRMVERKKYGLKKARRAPQWKKR